MAYLTIKNIKISGMAACVPKRIEENIDLPIFASREEAEKVIESTGIARRHVCDNGITASDLAVKAVERLLADLKWSADSVDCLFFVSMTRDYIAPQTACILQDRLGLLCDGLAVGVFRLGIWHECHHLHDADWILQARASHRCRDEHKK